MAIAILQKTIFTSTALYTTLSAVLSALLTSLLANIYTHPFCIMIFIFSLSWLRILAHKRAFFNNGLSVFANKKYTPCIRERVSFDESLGIKIMKKKIYFIQLPYRGVTRVTYTATFPTLYTYIITFTCFSQYITLIF